jgi:tetraacyldisaccharide 4'-kinase
VNPFSAIYGAASATRNYFYDRGVIREHKLSRPVISVGNISVGGAGKTPFVILLGSLLQKRGVTFDVLSRGYGRDTVGVLPVDPRGSPRQFGDEPLLIAKQLCCPVIVGRDRYAAGMYAETNNDCELHLLDDGFQHRSLARDFDIVLLTAEDLGDRLLPIGRLREPLSSLSRADALVVSEECDPAELPPLKLTWQLRRSLKIPHAVSLTNPVVFCGIARPHKFLEQLRASGIRPAAHKFYPDHHRYDGRDVRHLLDLRKRQAGNSFITTQKDVINLGAQFHQLAPISIAVVQMELADPADLLDTILSRIAERRAKA